MQFKALLKWLKKELWLDGLDNEVMVVVGG